MIAKSIIAGTVLSLMAGGVVYFGTDVEAENGTDITVSHVEHPHGDKVEKIKKTPAETKIKAKKVEVKKVAPKPVKKTEAKPEPKEKWLDQYMKKEAKNKEGGNGAAAKDTGKFVIKKKVVKNGEPIDVELFTEKDIAKAKKKGFKDRVAEVENVWVEKTDDKTERRVLRDILKSKSAISVGEGEGKKTVDVQVRKDENGETRVETETVDMGDGKIMKIVKKTVTSESHSEDGAPKMRVKVMNGEDINIEEMIGETIDLGDGKKMKVKVMIDKDGQGGMETLEMGEGKTIKIIKKKMGNGDVHWDGKHKIFISKAESRDISSTVKTVMEQAEKIEMPELRDRAYLDLVSYALEHGDYKVAGKALSKIEQVELRDTARNRMAVTYAKAGRSDEAFAVLEDIEVEALRDVMRLQVIEAMIAPEELPKDMQ